MSQLVMRLLAARGAKGGIVIGAGALLINLLLVGLVYRLVMSRDIERTSTRVMQFVEFVRLMPASREFDDAHHDSLPPPPAVPQRAPALALTSNASPAGGTPDQQNLSTLPTFPAIALPATGDSALLERALGQRPSPASNETEQGAATGSGSKGGKAGAGGASMLLRADEVEVNLVPSYKLSPSYPLRALKEGIEGVVTVEFAIDSDGNVRDPSILHAEPPGLFDEAVMAALPKWKFSPKLINGQSVMRRARQDVVFRLHRQ